MWRDRINPHEISLSKNVYAQITIKVESLTSSAVYKGGWSANICPHLYIWFNPLFSSDANN